MDSILGPLLESTEPDAVKKSILQRLIDADTMEMEDDACFKLLESSISWSLNSASAIHRFFGRKVIKLGEKNYSKILCQVCNVALPLCSGVSRPSAEIIDTISLLVSTLPQDQRWCYEEALQRCVSKWMERDDDFIYPLRLLSQVASFLTGLPMCIPSPSVMVRSVLSRNFLTCLANVRLSSMELNRVSLILQGEFQAISAFLDVLWSADSNLPIPGLTVILMSIANGGGSLLNKANKVKQETLSCCLTFALCSIRTAQVPRACRWAVFDSGCDDAKLAVVLTVLLEWLSVMPTPGLSCWVIEFMECMLANKSFASVLSAVMQQLPCLFARMQHWWTRQEILPVVSHVLLGVQHAPVCYKKVLPLAEELFTQLKAEGTLSALICLRSLSEVFQCLTSHFSTVPVPGVVLQYVTEHSSTKEEDIVSKLNGSSWRSLVARKRNHELDSRKQKSLRSASNVSVVPSAHDAIGSVNSIKGTPRVLSVCGRAGLVNLGNTCYVNSVLQALFMNFGFRKSLLKTAADKSRSPAVEGLQRVMSYLLLTKREAYSPRQFLSVARPAHFLPGTQQDCAEFCRHLLDVIHSQSSASNRSHYTGDTEATAAGSSASSSASSSANAVSVGTRAHPEVVPEYVSCVEKHYQLKLCTTYSCEVCNNKSCQSEKAFDLMLAFPTSHSSDVGEKVKAVPKPSETVCDVSSTSNIITDLTPPSSPRTEATATPPEVTNCKEVNRSAAQAQFRDAADKLESSFSKLQSDAALSSPPATTQQSASSANVTGIRGGERPSAKISQDIPDVVVSSPETSANSVSVGKAYRTPRCASSLAADSVPLTTLMENFLSPEVLDGDNAYDCENCGQRQRGLRTVTVSEAPAQLFITLMRFHFDRTSLQRSKIMTKVNYPQFLMVPCSATSTEASVSAAGPESEHDLSLDVNGDRAMSDGEDGDTSPELGDSRDVQDTAQVSVCYELRAVIVHAGGSTEHGHYYTFACGPRLDTACLTATVSNASVSSSGSASSTSGAAHSLEETSTLTCSENHEHRVAPQSSGAMSTKNAEGHMTAVVHPLPTGTSMQELSQDHALIVDQEIVSTSTSWSQSDNIPRTWHRFNDSTVNFSSLDEALRVGENGSTHTAYMLMYSRCSQPPQLVLDRGSGAVSCVSLEGMFSGSVGPLAATSSDGAASCTRGVLDECVTVVPPHLVDEVERDNQQLLKERSQNAIQPFPQTGNLPRPPPPPPPPPPSGCDFSSNANRLIC